MASPQILVVGAGSAGQRHARLLTELGADVSITDPDESRAGAVAGVTPLPFDLGGLGSWDGIVLASPTSFHAEQVPAATSAASHVLVEKPLAMDGEAARALAGQAPDALMVGYNLRLHRPIEDLVAGVHSGRIGRPLSARLWFGSHLPDWRPSVDYRRTYSARRELGGGVLLDAIHELDLLLWLLPGKHVVEGAIVARSGDLEIDVEDNVHAVLRHESDVPAIVSLDYLSRRYRRGIEVVGTAGTVRLDWARTVLEWEWPDRTDVVDADVPVLESYQRQASRFLQWIDGKAAPPVDGRTGAASVELADAIRSAAGA